jgi:hypothetical protein
MRQNMYDPRLIGTWRSDAKKTEREIDARADVPLQQKSKVKRFFGRLELHYTRSRCYSSLRGHITPIPFTVVAKDESSVAIVTIDPNLGRQIVHIHFEGNYYWVCLGNIREFFKRVK